MISVLVLGCRGPAQQPVAPGELVRTLAALVPATVEGLVRDVTLVVCGPHPALAKVADHAGCGFSEAGDFASALKQAARQARCQTVLVAQAGMMLDRSFIDEMAGLLPTLAEADRQSAYKLKAEPAGLAGRIFPSLAADAALLAARDDLIESRAGDFAALVRALRPRRRLNSKAWLVEEV